MDSFFPDSIPEMTHSFRDTMSKYKLYVALTSSPLIHWTSGDSLFHAVTIIGQDFPLSADLVHFPSEFSWEK